MEPLNLTKIESEWSTDSAGLAKQWKEMGAAIGEIRKQNARWRDYLEEIKSRQSWIRRWFAIG